MAAEKTNPSVFPPPRKPLELDIPLQMRLVDEAFMKKITGIQDTKALHTHITNIQSDGYAAWPCEIFLLSYNLAAA